MYTGCPSMSRGAGGVTVDTLIARGSGTTSIKPEAQNEGTIL